jgi:hypothetical protein
MMEEATRLLAELGVLRKDLPERHDKSYDSTVLDALNKGGFLYVSLRYLAWAKMLMTKVRASITVSVIRSLGNPWEQGTRRSLQALTQRWQTERTLEKEGEGKQY